MLKKLICFCLVIVMIFIMVVPASMITPGNTDMVYIDHTDTDKWNSETANINKRGINSKQGIVLSVGSEEHMYATYVANMSNTSVYTEICIEFLAKGNNSEFKIEFEGYYNDNLIFSEYRILKDSNENNIYIPFSSAGFDSLVVKSNDITYLAITSLSLDNDYKYLYSKAFSSKYIDIQSETVNIEGNSLVATSKTGIISFTPFFDMDHSLNKVYLAEIYMKTDSTGQLLIATDTDNKVTSEQVISSEKEEKYSFLIYGNFGNVSFIIKSSSNSFKVEFIKANLYEIGDIWSDEYGTFTNCTFNSGNIIITGALSGDSLTKFVGSNLCVFRALPNSTFEEAISENPFYEEDYSTKFEIDIPVSDSEHIRDYVYYLCIDTYMGMLQIGSPKVVGYDYEPYRTNGSEKLLSVDILDNDADILNSDVDSVLYTLKIEDLLCEGQDFTSIINIFEGEKYYYDSKLINSLKEKSNLYSSIGKKVYLCIESNTDFNNRIHAYLACCYYFSNIFNSFVLDYESDDINEKSFVIAACAGILKGNNSQTYVSMKVRAEDNFSSTVITQRYIISKYGIRTIGLMIEGTKDIFDKNGMGKINSALASCGFDTSIVSGILVQTDSESLDTYKEMYETASSYDYAFLGYKLIDFSSENCENIRKLFDNNEIKGKINSLNNKKNVIKLLDYTNSYETTGWNSAGNCFSPVSEYGFGLQRAVSIHSNGGTSVVVYTPTGPLNFNECEIGFRLNGQCESSRFDVKIVFVSNSNKYEFYGQIESNRDSVVWCDLSDFHNASSITNVFIFIKSQDSLTLNIEELRVASDNEIDLDTLHNTEAKNSNRFIISLITVIVFTIIVFIMILLYGQKGRKKRRS